MGNDGGSIPRREELVKLKKRKRQAVEEDKDESRWETCRLSKTPLQDPIVACPLGYLFNKDRLLEALLDNDLPKEFGYIQGLRDLHPVHFTRNPVQSSASFICPITGTPVAGRQHFSLVEPCGCVVNSRALKELIKSSENHIAQCPACGVQSEAGCELRELNPPAESVQSRREGLMERKRKNKNKNKNKKRRKTSKSEGANSEKKKDAGNPQQPAANCLIAASVAKAVSKNTLMPKYADKAVYESLFHSEKGKGGTHESKDVFFARHITNRPG